MQKICDLYFSEPTKSERLKFISIFDKQFFYSDQISYNGYLKINARRLKLVSVVMDLRGHGIFGFNVPIEYRDRANIPKENALVLANEYANSIGAAIHDPTHKKLATPPVYWTFDLRSQDRGKERVGGVVMIDRLDGHVWTSEEHEEYMYDYNNVL